MTSLCTLRGRVAPRAIAAAALAAFAAFRWGQSAALALQLFVYEVEYFGIALHDQLFMI